MGSKKKIARDIIAMLPSGKRFVDLFGGGFAMSHCAFLCCKYDGVLYNEINPQLPELIIKAIRGEYSYERFKPEFIDRETFFREKGKDGYIRYIWSFGNDGKTYMFGRNVEPLKREAHEFIVFGKPTQHFKEVERHVTASDIHTRRVQFCGYCREHSRFDMECLQRLESLQRLECLQRLESLQRLEGLQRLEINCGSYLDYQYQDGDIVYCDPPYEGTQGYGSTFDHEGFYEWARTRDYPVWFSSYEGVKGFKVVWSRRLCTSLGTGNSTYNTECLYTNA